MVSFLFDGPISCSIEFHGMRGSRREGAGSHIEKPIRNFEREG
jgi:hypothetical protein